MNSPFVHLNEWLDMIESSNIVLATVPGPSWHSDVDETVENTFAVSLGLDDAMRIAVSDLAEFVDRAVTSIDRRIRALPGRRQAWVYVWHDELAGQLRLSVSSAPEFFLLPFGRPPRAVQKETVLAAYLKANHDLYGLPITAMQNVSNIPSMEEKGEPLLLQVAVWATRIGHT